MITQFSLYTLADNNLKRNFKKFPFNNVHMNTTLCHVLTMMTRLAHWKLYTLAENYPEYMDRYSIMMERLKMAITWNASSIWNKYSIWFDRSELLCHQLLLKYKRDRESCWLSLEAGCTPCWVLARYSTGTSSQLRKERHCLRELPQAPPPRYALRYHWQQVSHPGQKNDWHESWRKADFQANISFP